MRGQHGNRIYGEQTVRKGRIGHGFTPKKEGDSAAPSKITGEVEAKILALCCGKPPAGRARWTLRLLEEKTVELGIVEAISDNTIGRLLKKRRLSLTGTNAGASRRSTTVRL